MDMASPIVKSITVDKYIFKFQETFRNKCKIAGLWIFNCQTKLFKISSKSKLYSFFGYHDTNSGLINHIEILYVNHNIKLCKTISGISITNFNIPVLLLINWRTAHRHRAIQTL